MRLSEDQIKFDGLMQLSAYVRQLFIAQNYASLAEQFGYALAFDQAPTLEIPNELSTVLKKLEASRLESEPDSIPRISYFKPNDQGLYALIEQIIAADNGKHILVEMIVTTKGGEKFITIEQISAVI